MSLSLGIAPYVIPSGFAGLYNLLDCGNLIELNEQALEDIDILLAGSVAGNSRVKIGKINDPNKYFKIKEGLRKYGIEGLVIAGGDDTGSVAVDFSENNIPCVHVPKTMDLDLQTYSVGGDSSVNRIARYIRELKTTGNSHNRIMIVEVFGRYCGQTALLGGAAGGADCILIPEIFADFDVVYENAKKSLFRRISRSPYKSGTYVIVVSEALADPYGNLITDDSLGVDAFGHKKLSGTGRYVREQLSARIKSDPEVPAYLKEEGLFVEGMYSSFEVRETVPAYLIRSGDVSAMDAIFGLEAGSAAVLLLKQGVHSVTVSRIKNGVIETVPIARAIVQKKVSEETLTFYEQMGICFGRKPRPYDYKIVTLEDATWSYF